MTQVVRVPMDGPDDSKSTKFDETYSLMLQGYIDQQEWRTAIAAVNQIYATSSVTKWIFIPVICVVVILVLLTVGALAQIFTLIPVAFVLFVFVCIIWFVFAYKAKQTMMQKMNEHIDSQNQRVWFPRGIQWRLRTEYYETSPEQQQQPYGNQGFVNHHHQGFGQQYQNGQQRKLTRTVHWIEIELAPRGQGQVMVPMSSVPMSSVSMSPLPPMSSVPMSPVSSVPQVSSGPQLYSPSTPVEERTGLLSNDAFKEVPINTSSLPPLSKFCGKCGTPTIVNESFCRNCGSYCRYPV